MQRNRYGLFVDPGQEQGPFSSAVPGPSRALAAASAPPRPMGGLWGTAPGPQAPQHPGYGAAKWRALMAAGLTMLEDGGVAGLGRSLARGAMQGLNTYGMTREQIDAQVEAQAKQMEEQYLRQQMADPRTAEALGLNADQARIFRMLPIQEQIERAKLAVQPEEPTYTTVTEGTDVLRDGVPIYSNDSPPPDWERVDTGAHLVWIDHRTGEPQFSMRKDVIPDDPDPIARSDALRKEFEARDEVKAWNTVGAYYGGARSALLSDNAYADMTMITAMAKVMDPNSVIRPSESQMVVDSNTIPERLRGQLNFLLGGGRLTPAARQNLLNEVERFARIRWNDYARVRGAMGGLAEATGAVPEQVFLNNYTPDFATGFQPVPIPGSDPVAGPADVRVPLAPPPGPVGSSGWPMPPAGTPTQEMFPWLRDTTGGPGGS